MGENSYHTTLFRLTQHTAVSLWNVVGENASMQEKESVMCIELR